MKPSDDKKTLFQDMQQHPERYTDEQIEAMMNEIDREPDTEAAWEAFKASHITNEEATVPTEKKTARQEFMRVIQSVAVIIIVALGFWGMKMMTSEKKEPVVAESNTAASPQYQPANTQCTYDRTMVKAKEEKAEEKTDAEEKTNAKEESLIAKNAEAENEKLPTEDIAAVKAVTSAEDVRIRGNSASSHDQPLYVVNGMKIPAQLIDVLNPDDIANIKVWKDDEKMTALYGEEAKNGVIEITLREGKELAYADILGGNKDGEKVYSVAEVSPQFPGGTTALKTFINENLKTPDGIEEAGVSGKIVITFTIDKEGNHYDYKMMRNLLKNADKTACEDSAIIKACTDEAIRVCRLMPKWKPGQRTTEEGMEPVNVKYVIPFLFGKKEVRIR